MTVLHNADDWRRYQVDYCRIAGLVEAGVLWGRGPQAFPCLVAATHQATGAGHDKIVACYVYVDDAVALLAAQRAASGQAGAQGGPQGGPQEGFQERLRVSGGCVGLTAPAAPAAPAEALGNHAHFHNALLAHVLTIVNFLVDTGICKAQQYEDRYTGFLAYVDRCAAADREALLRAPQACREPPDDDGLAAV